MYLTRRGGTHTQRSRSALNIPVPILFSAPSDLGRNLVSDAISSFLARHPGITVELLLSDSYIDIVGQGIDIAVRFGEIIDSTLRSRQLKARRRVICAAPAYRPMARRRNRSI